MLITSLTDRLARTKFSVCKSVWKINFRLHFTFTSKCPHYVANIMTFEFFLSAANYYYEECKQIGRTFYVRQAPAVFELMTCG